MRQSSTCVAEKPWADPADSVNQGNAKSKSMQH
jgi:hypothetical protein